MPCRVWRTSASSGIRGMPRKLLSSSGAALMQPVVGPGTHCGASGIATTAGTCPSCDKTLRALPSTTRAQTTSVAGTPPIQAAASNPFHAAMHTSQPVRHQQPHHAPTPAHSHAHAPGDATVIAPTNPFAATTGRHSVEYGDGANNANASSVVPTYQVDVPAYEVDVPACEEEKSEEESTMSTQAAFYEDDSSGQKCPVSVGIDQVRIQLWHCTSRKWPTVGLRQPPSTWT
eukprot:m.131009 g.131009  ORF g.131009 m.131009 type:complete len:231 (-) comp17475_c0_seq25:3442-4134(-)